MAFTIFSRSSWGSRITDLIVLSASFLLFVFLLDIRITQQVMIEFALYVTILFVCLRLARRIAFTRLKYSKRVFNAVLGNISGLVTGSLLVLLANQFFSVVNEMVGIVICASVLAFFVLGTLSPLILASQRDKMIRQ